MESNGGVYPNVLGLEMSLHHSLQSQNPQNPHQMPMAAYGHHHDGGDYHLQHPQSGKQGYASAAKSKNQSLTLSDDEEPGFTPENSADDGKRKMSPWQRMKWTDNMVRLLIMVVYYIGDEVGPDPAEPGSKKKGGGVLQKKGKWKSVSRAMMERGFYVSPQQCEDKFNDLNKRYKRVNDILGKGTSCRVVENQSLLDSMDHLSAKTKEEVRKLLNSKHLFFREMCAYHNSCGHGSEAEALPSASPVDAKKCSHTAERAHKEEEEEEDDEEEEEEENEEEDEEDEADECASRKRGRVEQLEGEIGSVMRDGSKSAWEKRQWMRGKMVALEEQHVGIQAQAFELEKQRLKWLKFSSKKEREMEREKLRNERMKLENERMVLVIRQKELDLMDFQQQQQQGHSSNRRGDPSSITG